MATSTIDRPNFAEQESSPAIQEFVLPPKSRELYSGDPNGPIDPEYAVVVKDSQLSIAEGDAFHLDKATYDAIMPANWQNLRAGEALEAFDKAYGAYVMRMQKVPEEQITAIQSYEEAEAAPEGQLQVNGVNIPYEVQQSGVDTTEWAKAETERRLRYVFHEADYHLNRVFVAGGRTYEVTNIEYTGLEGNYTTLKLGFVDIETGIERLDVPLDQVEALERANTPEESQNILADTDAGTPAEYEQSNLIKTEEIIQTELDQYDERTEVPDPLERLEFENFLRSHPSLMTIPANLPTEEVMEEDGELPEPLNERETDSTEQEALEDIQYDREIDEQTRNFYAIVTRLALRHPLGEELIEEIVDEYEEARHRQEQVRDEVFLAYEKELS